VGTFDEKNGGGKSHASVPLKKVLSHEKNLVIIVSTGYEDEILLIFL
jgi:hypothetical protein